MVLCEGVGRFTSRRYLLSPTISRASRPLFIWTLVHITYVVYYYYWYSSTSSLGVKSINIRRHIIR